MAPNGPVSRRAEASLERMARIEYFGLASDDGNERLIMTLMTEVENFSDGLIEELIALSKIEEGKFGRELVKNVGDQFYQSWAGRKRWLRSFEVWVDQLQERNLFALADLRNAVAHGASRLTRKQTSDFPKQIALEAELLDALGYLTEGGHLFSGPDSRVRIFSAARGFLLQLDVNCCIRYPSIIEIDE